MFRRLQIAALALAGLVLMVQPASAQRFVRRGPGFVRPYYRPYYGYGYGFGYGYGPSWYGPGFYYPYGRAYLVPHSGVGEVKIVTKVKGESIYVDGGYAGVTGKLKHFDLTPGNHEIEIRDPGGKAIFQQRVQVIMDHTTEIHPPA
jgi:hypothetical protein